MTDALHAADIRSIMLSIKNLMEENRNYLIELDGIMGDGDLGITMTRGFDAAYEEILKSGETNPGRIFILAGMAIAKAAPSTMGTLVATGFMRGGKAIVASEKVSPAELAAFFEAFTHGVMERGKAKPGDKTIVDVLHPVSVSLSADLAEAKSLDYVINNAVVNAEEALKNSAKLKAQFGRAAYYQDASIGKQDAGATAAVLIIKGFSMHIKSINKSA